MREPILAPFKMGVKVPTMSVCVGAVREPPVLPPGRMKSEIRNPKHETISNDRNSNDQKNKFWKFEHSNFEFVSDFEIRYSDLIIVSFMPQSYDGIYFGGTYSRI